MPDLVGQRLGKLEITSRLGESSTAEVYRAWNPALGRDVAVKVFYTAQGMDEASLRRSLHEGRRAAALRHHNIAQIYDFDMATVDGETLPYVVMEFAPGRSLQQRLGELKARGQTMPLGEMLKLMQAVGNALDYAHQHRVVHGDLKPANILFASQGEPLLADFGMAAATGLDLADLSGTATGAAYMAPEQARGELYDARADIYSLGVILFELCTGRLPFKAETLADFAARERAIVPRPSQFNPALPLAVEQVILKALSQSPAERYQSVSEMMAALQGAIAGASPIPEKSDKVASAPESAQSESAAQAAEARRESVRNFLIQLTAMFTTVIALLEKFVGAVNILRNPLIGFIVIGIGLGAMTISAGYVLLHPRAYGRWQRWVAAIGLAVTLLAATGWGGWTLYEMRRPPKGLIVLIAEFERAPDALAVDYSRRIQAGILQVLRELEVEGVYVERTDEVYSEENARVRAAVHKASIVIYGWYDDAGINPRFELVRAPQQYVPILKQAGVGLASLDRLEVRLDKELKEMSYIAAAAIGLVYLADGQSSRALTFFDLALDSLPGGTLLMGKEGVYFYKASCHFYEYQFAEAVTALEEAVRINRDFYAAHLNLAIAYNAACDTARALEEANVALALKPDSPDAQQLRGFLLARENRWAEAADAYAEALKLSPDSAAIHSALAQAHEKLGRLDEAAAEYKKALELADTRLKAQPDDPQAIAAHADILFSQGELDEAAAQYQQAIDRALALKLRPDRLAWFYRSLGLIRWQQERWPEAIQAYSQAISLSPGLSTDHVAIGVAYQRQGMTTDALAAYQQAITLQPCDANAHDLLGDLYWQQGKAEEALQEYRQAVKYDPGSFVAWHSIGDILSQQGRMEEAKEAYEAAAAAAESYLEGNPRDATATYLLGALYYLLGNYEQAIPVLERAVAMEPDAASHYALANAYYEAQDYTKAVAHYQAALAADPQHAASAFGLGGAYESLGKIEEAIAAYRQALALEESGETHVALAKLYETQGRLEEAAVEYQAAVDVLEPESLASGSYRTALASLLIRLCRSDEAVTVLQPSLEGDEEPAPEAMAVLAAAYEALGRTAEAEQTYEALLRTYSSLPGIHYLTAWFAYRQGRLPEAIAEMQEAVELLPAFSLAWSSLGYFHDVGGDLAAASSAHETALEAMPSNVNALVGLGEVALQQGRAEDALTQFQEALQQQAAYAKTIPDETKSALVSIHLNLALAYERLGHTAEAEQEKVTARQLAEEVVGALPHHSRARFQLAAVYWFTGETTRAEAAIAEAIRCDASLAEEWERMQGAMRRLLER